MMRVAALLLTACLLPAWGGDVPLRPPLWADPDGKPIARPQKQDVSELYAVVYNSWFRHLNAEHAALRAHDRGALDVNAWDEAPDSSWFTNRIGRQPMAFAEILGGLDARPPEPPPWTVEGVTDEGYTPKLNIRDSAGRHYILKFDPVAAERNSGAERICTLIFYAAGYNVPRNTLAYFRPADLRLDDAATIKDAVGKKRRMTAADLDSALTRVKPLGDGRYRVLASFMIDGGVGAFKYTGTRKDDPNDVIPHELRRELRGMYVVASWVNHADAGDKNTLDQYVAENEKGFLRHYLVDFGSTLGSGDFVNGPYRVGHEYVFDGAAMGRTLVTFGIWRRPWETEGRITYPEVGYYQPELFEPRKWKPNYPNLAFERMDEADAYWGAKIVTAFNDELIQQLAEAGEYSRPEVTAYIADALKRRRDIIGSYWLDRITPLEDFALQGDRLVFRDVAIERGYAKDDSRSYQLSVGHGGATGFQGHSVHLPAFRLPERAAPDRYGRVPVTAIRIQSRSRSGGWALPVEVFLGRNGDSAQLEVLGWRHAAR